MLHLGESKKPSARVAGRWNSTVNKNALDGADILYFYAVICAQVGERDLAIEQLKHSRKSRLALLR